jgi:hypothetical protein
MYLIWGIIVRKNGYKKYIWVLLHTLMEVGSFPPIRRTVAKGGGGGPVATGKQGWLQTTRDGAGGWLQMADDGGCEDVGGYPPVPPPSLMEQFIKKVH